MQLVAGFFLSKENWNISSTDTPIWIIFGYLHLWDYLVRVGVLTLTFL